MSVAGLNTRITTLLAQPIGKCSFSLRVGVIKVLAHRIFRRIDGKIPADELVQVIPRLSLSMQAVKLIEGSHMSSKTEHSVKSH